MVIFLICLVQLSSANLGLSPSKKYFNYVPGEEIIVKYHIFEDNPERKLDISVEGDLKDYVHLSKNELTGGGDVTVTIGLPESVGEMPGDNDISIVVKQQPFESQFIGTAIELSSTITIFVPYPGKYIQAVLQVPNGNVDDEIPIELKLTNRGKSEAGVSSRVDIKTEGENKGSVNFSPFILAVNEEKTLQGVLNTQGYRPGDYLADAFVNYGDGVSNVNQTFRIGSLFVNVTDFSDELSQGGIQKFLIDVQSLWNSDIDDVYADVNISNEVESFVFRTPSIPLNAWSEGTLEGFLDTSDMSGEYETEITLNYLGSKSLTSGILSIKKSSMIIVIIVIGVILAVILLLALIRRKRKRRKR